MTQKSLLLKLAKKGRGGGGAGGGELQFLILGWQRHNETGFCYSAERWVNDFTTFLRADLLVCIRSLEVSTSSDL